MKCLKNTSKGGQILTLPLPPSPLLTCGCSPSMEILISPPYFDRDLDVYARFPPDPNTLYLIAKPRPHKSHIGNKDYPHYH